MTGDAPYDPDDDPELEALLRPVWDDVPELERLGIFADTGVDYEPDVAEVARKVAELAVTAEPYEDESGFLWQVTAAAVDEDGGRAAWVEWQENDRANVVIAHYWLKARDRDGRVARWEIETYNPYFGCRVGHLRWHGGAVVLVYADKHDTFVAAAARGEPVRWLQITPEWSVEGDVLAYRDGEGEHRLSLPSLEPMA
ncbi:MAG TPA: hypothetical protein VHG91_08295 [Longimicrobium sp.]|nr:hypothetical protein [Longimicrobium sp.]